MRETRRRIESKERGRRKKKGGRKEGIKREVKRGNQQWREKKKRWK